MGGNERDRKFLGQVFSHGMRPVLFSTPTIEATKAEVPALRSMHQKALSILSLSRGWSQSSSWFFGRPKLSLSFTFLFIAPRGEMSAVVSLDYHWEAQPDENIANCAFGKTRFFLILRCHSVGFNRRLALNSAHRNNNRQVDVEELGIILIVQSFIARARNASFITSKM